MKVYATFRGKKKYYAAIVVEVYPDCHYRLKYEDGDVEPHYPEANIRSSLSPASSRAQSPPKLAGMTPVSVAAGKEEHIQLHTPLQHQQVLRAAEQHKAQVQLKAQEKMLVDKMQQQQQQQQAACAQQSQSQLQPQARKPLYKVGARVHATSNLRRGRFLLATVMEVFPDFTYKLKYDNGSSAPRYPEHQVKNIKAWACNVCTYENKTERVCAMCNTERPSLVRVPKNSAVAIVPAPVSDADKYKDKTNPFFGLLNDEDDEDKDQFEDYE